MSEGAQGLDILDNCVFHTKWLTTNYSEDIEHKITKMGGTLAKAINQKTPPVTHVVVTPHQVMKYKSLAIGSHTHTHTDTSHAWKTYAHTHTVAHTHTHTQLGKLLWCARNGLKLAANCARWCLSVSSTP